LLKTNGISEKKWAAWRKCNLNGGNKQQWRNQ